MANRRTLKKQMRYVLSELVNECMICNMLIPAFTDTKMDSIIGDVMEMNNEFIKRINAPEGTKNVAVTKKFYGDLIMDFNKQVNDVIDAINSVEEA